jgi:lysophospholipase L1-like esterase
MLLLSPWAASAPVTHCSLPRSRPWRVAFIGDSITKGNTTFGRPPAMVSDGPPQWHTAVGCWPCELRARALRDNVDMQLYNLGVWGVPVLSSAHSSKADHTSPPYSELLDGRFSQAVPAALADADVLLVMLGTNDGKSDAAEVRSHFENDLRSLVERLLAMRHTARNRSCAWLLPPPLIHGGSGSGPVFGIQPAVVRALSPRVRAVATAVGVGVIDVRAPLEQDWRASFGRAEGGSAVGDGVHPPPYGMRVIAETVWQKLAQQHGRARRALQAAAAPTVSGRRRLQRRRTNMIGAADGRRTRRA